MEVGMRPPASKELLAAAGYTLDQAKKMGASQCAVSAYRNQHQRVLCRDGKWEELKGATQQRLSIRLFVDGRYGVHHTSEFAPRSIKGFLEKAFALTRQLMVDKHRHLPGSQYYKGRSSADLGLFDPAHSSLDLAKRQKTAKAAWKATRDSAGKNMISAAAGFSDGLGQSVLVHSDGSSGRRPSDWNSASTRKLASLPSPGQVGRKASERARGWLGADKIASERLPIIVENRAAGRIVRWLLRPLAGSALHQHRSCFDTHLGKVIAATNLTLTDEPLLKEGLGSRRYDWEGMTARKLPIIHKGVLKNYLMDTYSAEKLARKPTTGGTSNLIFVPGTRDLTALVRSVKRGLLVTRFIGGNSNSTTGDFSVGLSGFMVEDGRVGKPVVELNIADNHLKFWKNLTELGSDPYPYSSMRTPSLLFGSVMVAGK
jgi:PmbA protein